MPNTVLFNTGIMLHSRLLGTNYYFVTESLQFIKQHLTSPTSAPGTTILFFVSMSLTILGTSYKWNQAVFVLL